MTGRVPPWGLGQARTCFRRMKLPGEIELLFARPGELHRVEPFLRVFIALLVIAQRRAEHRELALVPAADDVEAEAAFADMIGGDEFLGRDQRMEERRMHRAEHGHAPRLGEEARGPAHGLERRALIVGVAAIALPAPDRQHEIDAGLVGHLREPHIVAPASRPALGNQGDGPSGGAIGAEQPELQAVRIMHGRAVMRRRITNRHHRSS